MYLKVFSVIFFTVMDFSKFCLRLIKPIGFGIKIQVKLMSAIPRMENKY